MPDKTLNDESQFEEPKLRFVEPQLEEAGDLTKVTKGFFGTFSP